MVVVIIVLSAANTLLRGPKLVSVSPTPVSNQVARFGEILPGQASIDKVNELLGSPLKTTKTGEKVALDYKTRNQYINHQVIAENNIVRLIKEAVIIGDDKNADTIKEIYGTVPEILYEQAPYSVFNLYVYPGNGIAYLGHEDGTILEIWYFEPTTLSDFIAKWAPNFAEKKFTGQSKY